MVRRSRQLRPPGPRGSRISRKYLAISRHLKRPGDPSCSVFEKEIFELEIHTVKDMIFLRWGGYANDQACCKPPFIPAGFATGGYAQTATGQANGTVRNSSGSAVLSATVNLSNAGNESCQRKPTHFERVLRVHQRAAENVTCYSSHRFLKPFFGYRRSLLRAIFFLYEVDESG